MEDGHSTIRIKACTGPEVTYNDNAMINSLNVLQDVMPKAK
jgi:hypothetical protein